MGSWETAVSQGLGVTGLLRRICSAGVLGHVGQAVLCGHAGEGRESRTLSLFGNQLGSLGMDTH